MPSPFPGMDPYLEHPALFPGLHQRLIADAAATLNVLLPPHYVADIGERLYVVQPERSIDPDVFSVEQPPAPVTTAQGAGGTAVAVASDSPWVITAHPIEMPEVFIQILAVPDESRVVTVIEVLSPSNKTVGSEGRQLYLTKQREVLNSPTHLIEIDLLQRGEHTVAAPLPWLLERGTWNYLVSLHRGGQGGRYEVWPILLRKRFPRIRVPLADSDPDVVLDLQAVFDRGYDNSAYARRLDYRRDPPTPLAGGDAAWAEALLHECGLR